MNGLGKNRTWAGVLDLPQNPDFSGFASRFFWKHQLPGLADSHVRETVSFPDLLSESAERRPPALLQVDTCREEHSGSVCRRGGSRSNRTEDRCRINRESRSVYRSRRAHIRRRSPLDVIEQATGSFSNFDGFMSGGRRNLPLL